mmetsp:Transcript_4317/g.7864  ORF Transcript_4317/g.7864 Transcript_4317/m.7864 type:complete len:153 (+) Transcript_4317:829-1287(+)
MYKYTIWTPSPTHTNTQNTHSHTQTHHPSCTSTSHAHAHTCIIRKTHLARLKQLCDIKTKLINRRHNHNILNLMFCNKRLHILLSLRKGNYKHPNLQPLSNRIIALISTTTTYTLYISRLIAPMSQRTLRLSSTFSYRYDCVRGGRQEQEAP